MLWQYAVQTPGLASFLREATQFQRVHFSPSKATQFQESDQAARRCCRAEEAGGQARAQGRAGPRARAWARRGRGRGAGRRG